MQVDQSQISRSTSDGGSNGLRRKIVLGQSSKIDIVFPLVDNITQHTQFPLIISSFISIFFYLQVLFSAIWPVSSFWSREGTFGKAFNILQIIFWFTEVDATKDYLTILIIILAAILVLAYGFIIFSLYRFKTLHRFEKWNLYPSRFILEAIAPIMFHPAAAFTGASLKLLYQSKDAVLWAFVIFGIFFLIAAILLFAAGFSLFCSSACLIVTNYSMFDPISLIVLCIASTVLVVLSYFISLFPDWVFYFIQIIHAGICGFLIYICTYMPFHKKLGNHLNASTLSVCILMDILMIVFANVSGVPQYTPFIILIVAFIVAYIVYFFISKIKTRKICKQLKYTSDQMSDEEKNAHFIELGLHLNEMKALMYLRIGFANICDMFIDWSLTKFIAQNYTSNKALSACIQILTFFPGESRQLNTFFYNITAKRNLSFSQRFLVYQVYRVKTLRQSSASSDANEKLAELKRLSQQCESDINGFWIATEACIGYFEQIAASVNTLNALWLEAIRDFPNNSKFSDEYCRFLTECATDFDNAIIQKQRSEMIEMGTNFSIDISFRSMVRQYPDYLKKGILDLKGNIKSRTHGKKTGTSSNSKMSDFGTSNIEIDAELENSIGKLLFRHSKLRIALHHSIKDRTLPTIDYTPITGVISVIASCAAFIGLFVYFKLTYSERGTSMDRLNYISSTRFYYSVSNQELLMDFLTQTQRMNSFLGYDSAMLAEDEVQTRYIDVSRQYPELIMESSVNSRNYFISLLDEISVISENGINVYELADEILEDIVNITTCYNASRLTNFESNLKNLLILGYYHQAELASIDKKDFFTNDNYCEILANWASLQTAADSLFTAFSSEQVTRGDDLKNVGDYLIIIIPVLLFIITAFPISIMIIMFFSNIHKFSDALFHLDHDVKEEARLPLRRDSDDETQDSSEPKTWTSVGIYIIIAEVLISAGLTVLCVLMVYFATECNNTISNLNRWEYYAAQRFTLVAECLHQTLLVVILNGSLPERFTTRNRQRNFATTSLNNLKLYNENLLQGTSTMDPCYNVDDLLDEYNILDACDSQEGDIEIHNLFKCASANQVISVFSDIVQDMLLTPDKYNGAVDDVTTSALIHLCDVHLWRRLDQSLERIVELGSIQYNSMITTLIILMVVGILLSFFSLAYTLYTQKRMKFTFSSVKTLIKKLPPLQIVNNKQLLNLLLNRDSIKKEDEVSVNSSIVRSNLDGILCTGLTGVVEIVNPSVSTILGYTPEQLLGQPLTVFFTEKEGEKIEKQLTLMRNGQSANTYEDHTICVTDSTNEVHCHITILGMTNSHDSVESFVIILRDETELLQHQKEAEEAKAQSENLLFQILPRSIVTRLNQGEKDISFSVPSASIIFIDIVKFSDYAALLTPEEIMGNLSQVFAAFDRLLEKYPLVIKIKLIGDVYMGAGGLFTPEEPPQTHAEQVIRFALDCLTELDEVNVKLNANLCVRIGVNSGGPIIAGVLGTDKPVFDIIGDPINVASRLQSTDIPGRVQIPQSTYDLISGMNFEIEERGEVFLKGKGKTLAYFVKPFNIFMAQMSSSSEFKSAQKMEVQLISSTTSNLQIMPSSIPPTSPV